MGRSLRSVLSSRAVGVRDETAEALDHLMAAVQHGATDVGERSHRAGATARDRAAAAVLAFRGHRQSRPWPWLVAGLAIGVVVGGVAGAVLVRRRPAPARDADVAVTDGEPDRPGVQS